MLAEDWDGTQVVHHLRCGHRAHPTNVLSHHEVWMQVADGRGVDFVQRTSITRGKRYGVLDLRAGLAGEVKRRASDHRQSGGLRRGGALLRHRPELLAAPNRRKPLR